MEQKHLARGLCSSCYHKEWYASHSEDRQRSHKAYRLKVQEKLYKRKRAWEKAHKRKTRRTKREYRERNGLIKSIVGKQVKVLYAGFPCKGIIRSRVNRSVVRVELTGGTMIDVWSAHLLEDDL